MKQNIYDDSGFFDEYGKMPRSKEGLHAAGEWHVLKTMFPDFEHKNVLDLGCGYGWHCIYAMQQGASHVIGVDLSAKMIRKAKENSAGLDIDYRQMAIEDVNFATEEFDIVISSLALHYIKDLENVFQKVNHFLKRGGALSFLWNIRYSQQERSRIGIRMNKVHACTGLWIITSRKAEEMQCSWDMTSSSITEPWRLC
ncbi:methyltransferase domain protein [Sphingobacterium spiritivorum ATCC 33300]|uniref:Methyltransferase domain protein n=1 Tax=Sphingobacterium spiritivorum ATCC 33300 TaxID=525372 RepID=C2G5I2_SPHSI|nr:methyltransferase domain protein [Sphingobacterium spiritivorum ATCC 33300]